MACPCHYKSIGCWNSAVALVAIPKEFVQFLCEQHIQALKISKSKSEERIQVFRFRLCAQHIETCESNGPIAEVYRPEILPADTISPEKN